MKRVRGAGVRRLAAAVVAAVAAGGLGCADLVSRPAVEKKQYVLEARRDGNAPSPRGPGDAPSPRGAGVLELAAFRVSPRAAGTRFVYRTGDDRYDSDFYHVLWAAPQVLVADETRRWLAAAGLFEDVLEAGSAVPPTFVLEGALSDLYGDFRPGETPRAVIAMRFALVDVRGRTPRVVMSREYLVETPIPDASPDVLAAGWNTGLSRILTELEADLRATPRK